MELNGKSPELYNPSLVGVSSHMKPWMDPSCAFTGDFVGDDVVGWTVGDFDGF